MSEQARIETAVEMTIDNCEVLRARLAKYEDADGNPKAQPSGVVLPEPEIASEINRLIGLWDAKVAWSGQCMEELLDHAAKAATLIARLNSSSVSAGDDAQYPPCDYCAEPLSYHPWHGSGLINGVESRHIHACDKCRHLLPTVSAGDDRETIRAVFLRNGFTIKEGQADLKPYVYAAADELMSIARAALSAPSHGGGVAHTDCRSEDGITVGLIDSIITSCRVLSSRDLTCEAAVEALRDLRSDSDVSLIKPNHSEQVREGWQLVPVEPTDAMLEAGDKYIGTPATYKAMLSACPSPAITNDFSQFLSAVMDAAGLIRHGRQSKELSEYLGMKCMEYRAAPSAGSQGGDV